MANTNPNPNTNTANIKGHIVDSDTDLHIPFVTIYLKGTTIGVVADNTGHYTLADVPVGKYTIVASSMGYEEVERDIEITASSSKNQNFYLKEQADALSEVVVSASREEISRKKASAIVNLVGEKLFSATAASAINESLSFQPGLRVENTCNNCGASQLRINGLEGQYSQILMDSRAIFSSLAQVYGIEQIPVSMVERIEVIRGGGSALFGSSAIGGVVNIITKEPTRNTLSISNITNFIGNSGAVDYTNSINGSFVSRDNKTGVYLYGMTRDREGYDYNGDGFTELTAINAETIGFRAYHKINSQSKLTADYHHIAEFRRGGDNIENQPHTAKIAEQLEHNINGGGLTYDYFSKNYKHKFSMYGSLQSIARQSYFGTNMNLNAYGKTSDLTYLVGGQYIYSMNKCLFMPSNLSVGVEYNSNDLHDVMKGYDRDLKQKTNTIGGYLQNEWKNNKINFVLGFRLDKHNMIDNVIFSPRANIRYTPIKGLGLRLSYSSGYRAPQAYNEDLHIEAVNNAVSIIHLADGLRPEYSSSFSGSVNYYKSFGSLDLDVLLEGFYTDLDDVFTLTETGTDAEGNILLERGNGSGAKVAGLTTEIRLGYNDVFDVQMGYTFQKSNYDEPEQWSEDVEGQRTMYRSPDHYGYFTVNAKLYKDLDLNIFGTYTGSMLVQHGAGYIPKDIDVRTDDFFDLGAKLNYRFNITKSFHIDLQAGVKNIFNAYQNDLDVGETKDAGYIYGPSLPRTYFFGVKLGF